MVGTVVPSLPIDNTYQYIINIIYEYGIMMMYEFIYRLFIVSRAKLLCGV